MEGDSAQALNKKIAELYDEETDLCEETYREHMHYGFYDPNAQVSATIKNHRPAQIRLIEEALHFAGLSEDSKKWPKNVIDVGCGVEGSSLYFAKKYGSNCHGINLSPVQIERAKSLAAAEGLVDKVFFQVADAADQPFPDGQFDLVWVVETANHMPDRKKLLSELFRVAAPGGRVILISSFIRNLNPSEESLQEWEKQNIQKMNDVYHLPGWCSMSYNINLFESLSFQDIRTAEWTQNIIPFVTSHLAVDAIPSSAATLISIMMDGYKNGLLNFGIITCQKPQN